MCSQTCLLYMHTFELISLPQQVHQTTLPGNGCLDSISEMHCILTFLQKEEKLFCVCVWIVGLLGCCLMKDIIHFF